MRPDDDLRWLVETADRGFHDVGAETVEIADGGTLVFRDKSGSISVAYAHSAWTSVVVDE